VAIPTPLMTTVMNGGGGFGGWNEDRGYEHVENMFEIEDFSDIESDGEEVGNATGIKYDY
jgi:hypothetical protein